MPSALNDPSVAERVTCLLEYVRRQTLMEQSVFTGVTTLVHAITEATTPMNLQLPQ